MCVFDLAPSVCASATMCVCCVQHEFIFFLLTTNSISKIGLREGKKTHKFINLLQSQILRLCVQMVNVANIDEKKNHNTSYR